MFLKNLTLKGFKSFADTTKLDLTAGITVVVGPNGSGKSNVVDAIAWVLGAQAPRAVRSGKMDDVIFAGTTKRSALGRAEVSLTIDNSDGALPIDFTEVTLTRVLFRTGDSEYAINGVPCRLLDIQELLSDSGVGRQQHVIVSQGQIDAVLNARPEERRFIIEEAAGILKFRRRKEKAERRLLGTEANLVRLQDLLREIRRQLRPLERQAEAARRHGDVSAALQEIRVFLAGRELAGIQNSLNRSNTALVKLKAEQAELEKRLGVLDAQVIADESRLDSFGNQDLADDFLTFETLAARAKSVRMVIEERQRYAERDLAVPNSNQRLDDLLAESEMAAAAVATVEAELAHIAEEESRLSGEETNLARTRSVAAAGWSIAAERPEAQTGEVRGELSALSTSTEHTKTELERIAVELVKLQDSLLSHRETQAALDAQLAETTQHEQELVKEAAKLQEQLLRQETQHQRATELWHGRQADAARWAARAEALGQALDEARARAGAQTLAEVVGVVGTLLDVLIIDSGWEAACEAALGDALSAVVVEGIDPGRFSLEVLAENQKSVMVLPLGLFHHDKNKGEVLPISQGQLPSGVDAGLVLKHVRSKSAPVQSLLDHLLANALVVEGDWQQGLDLALERPDHIVVTKAGDRFSPTGWRLGVGGAGATGAAYEEALTKTENAQRLANEAFKAQGISENDLKAADEASRNSEKVLVRKRFEINRLVQKLEQLKTQMKDTSNQVLSLESRYKENQQRYDADKTRQNELEVLLPALEADEEERRRQRQRQSEERVAFDEQAQQISGQRRSLELRKVEYTQQLTHHRSRISELRARVVQERQELKRINQQRQQAESRLVTLSRLLQRVAAQEVRLQSRLTTLNLARTQRSDEVRQALNKLEALRNERTVTERQLQEHREHQHRESLAVAEAELRLETLTRSIRVELDCEPAVALAKELPEIPEGQSPKEWRRYLEREIRIMGPINPLALAEFETLSERHEFLSAQLEDVRSTRRDLAKIIRTIDAEIVDVFAAAYHDVGRNFTELFSTLFPGGKGALHLTDELDLLTSGVEVEARPSGKNVAKLSLLSGGERSLTALAFLFAVFRSRPSPFYVMDEVEAALDDVNLHRFLQLLHEFRADAQLLIVSHQKRTMEIADCLYGVSMQPGGSSKVVSERVD